MGMTVSDIDEMDMGMIYDMFAEAANDDLDYPEVADQSDFDTF